MNFRQRKHLLMHKYSMEIRILLTIDTAKTVSFTKIKKLIIARTVKSVSKATIIIAFSLVNA